MGESSEEITAKLGEEYQLLCLHDQTQERAGELYSEFLQQTADGSVPRNVVEEHARNIQTLTKQLVTNRK
ncbi:MAG: hypothetical protein KJ718_05165 [Nanoarchaeota archaeon]|nr:hypothetical protein [Nanoarchaeota archaeon]MBU1051916.1 hypothetical protein [Nanoarchaeota archaeon]MBU1988730.1 hypothetical protein [Nanoarchaeota archaeon]